MPTMTLMMVATAIIGRSSGSAAGHRHCSPGKACPERRSKGAPARYLGHVHAPDEKSAIGEAAKEFRVPENLHDRIAVMRDD